jgi:hypothetical protein
MSDPVNEPHYYCAKCKSNYFRNKERNDATLASKTEADLVIDGILDNGPHAMSNVPASRQVYAPLVTEANYVWLQSMHPDEVLDFYEPHSHILSHMPIRSVMAVRTVDRVLLVRLVSEAKTGAMRGRFVFSPSGSTEPWRGCAEGAEYMMHVEGGIARPRCTMPFETVHRDIEVIGYLHHESPIFNKIVTTKQVTTTVKLLARLTDIKPTLADAMAPVVVSSNSSASSSSVPVHMPCECYEGHEAMLPTVTAHLAKAITIHGMDLNPVEGCDCPICSCKIGLCVECYGVLSNEDVEEECV